MLIEMLDNADNMSRQLMVCIFRENYILIAIIPMVFPQWLGNSFVILQNSHLRILLSVSTAIPSPQCAGKPAISPHSHLNFNCNFGEKWFSSSPWCDNCSIGNSFDLRTFSRSFSRLIRSDICTIKLRWVSMIVIGGNLR